MQKPNIIYFTNMDLLSRKAHVVQIVKTAAALSALGLRVKLVVRKAGEASENTFANVGIYQGIKNLETIEYRRRVLLPLLAERAIFYTRSVTWAIKLVRLKTIHRNPIVFETHRKLLYYKNDPETGVTNGIEDRDILEHLYNRADGVLCSCGRTHAKLRERGIRTIQLWYGWTSNIDVNITASRATDIGYIGFKREIYRIIEALRDISCRYRFHIFGGNDTEISKFRNKIDTEIRDRIILHGFIKHRDLHTKTKICGTMIAANEGIKLADYLTVAGAIIAPDLPSIKDILANSACYFKFNDLDSLREAIARVISDSALYLSLREKSARLRTKYIWPHKGAELLKFIEEI